MNLILSFYWGLLRDVRSQRHHNNSLAQNRKAEDMPPLLTNNDNHPTLWAADIVDILDGWLTGWFEMG
jgi:hypothetical protein